MSAYSKNNIVQIIGRERRGHIAFMLPIKELNGEQLVKITYKVTHIYHIIKSGKAQTFTGDCEQVCSV